MNKVQTSRTLADKIKLRKNEQMESLLKEQISCMKKMLQVVQDEKQPQKVIKQTKVTIRCLGSTIGKLTWITITVLSLMRTRSTSKNRIMSRT